MIFRNSNDKIQYCRTIWVNLVFSRESYFLKCLIIGAIWFRVFIFRLNLYSMQNSVLYNNGVVWVREVWYRQMYSKSIHWESIHTAVHVIVNSHVKTHEEIDWLIQNTFPIWEEIPMTQKKTALNGASRFLFKR